jgi:hypothetical protein
MRHSIAFNFYEMAGRHPSPTLSTYFFFYSVGQLLMQQLGSIV